MQVDHSCRFAATRPQAWFTYRNGPSTGSPFCLRDNRLSPNLPPEKTDHSFIWHVSLAASVSPSATQNGGNRDQNGPVLVVSGCLGLCGSPWRLSWPPGPHRWCARLHPATDHRSQGVRRTQTCTHLASPAKHCNPTPALFAFPIGSPIDAAVIGRSTGYAIRSCGPHGRQP